MRIYRLCHRQSRDRVCTTCRRVTDVFARRQMKGVKGRPEWLASVERQLSKY